MKTNGDKLHNFLESLVFIIARITVACQTPEDVVNNETCRNYRFRNEKILLNSELNCVGTLTCREFQATCGLRAKLSFNCFVDHCCQDHHQANYSCQFPNCAYQGPVGIIMTNYAKMCKHVEASEREVIRYKIRT